MRRHCLFCDLGGGAPTQFRVRPDRVVIVLPFGQLRPCMSQRGEQRLVQAFVAQLAVEALDGRILGRLAKGRVMPFHAAFLRPAQDRDAGQLGLNCAGFDGDCLA